MANFAAQFIEIKVLTRLYFFFLFIIPIHVFSADTLHITLRQADSMFLKNNYQLLAAGMQVDIQKAMVLQSKLYPNPILTGEMNAYDPQNDKPLHVGKTGEKAFQFEQLILLGGKRMAMVEIAKTNQGIAVLEFQDLVRHLKYELHSSIYLLNQQIVLIQKYNRQLSLLDTILTAYDVQLKKGNIPLRDIVRLKGVYMDLNNSRSEVFRVYFEALARVQVLIQSDLIVKPEITDELIAASVKEISLDSLNQIALRNRPDYLVTLEDKNLAMQYLDLQRKLAVPDINLFTSYDQRGGAFVNQINFGIGIPLPLWNRNQGNIRAAELQAMQQNYQLESMKVQLLAEVHRYYMQYTQSVIEYRKAGMLYNDDFDVTLKGITENFQKGNVRLLEFVDFFESYNNAMAEIVRVKIQMATSAELLNLCAGKEII